MSKRFLRAVVLITGLITALVHLVVLNITMIQTKGSPDLLFTLNGLGYLGLLALFFMEPEFLAEQWDFFHYVFMAFAAVTIVAFLLLGGTGFGGTQVDPVGWLTKLDELILIIALWLHSRKSPAPTSAS
ncbi:MAG: hypothetical protein ACLFWD_06405 [Anaerolineales bacterium]